MQSAPLPSRDVFPLASNLPKPHLTWVNAARAGGETVTAVTRKWAPGTGYCGRCPRFLCNARDDVCLIVVVGRLAKEDAPTLTLDAAACDGLVADDVRPAPHHGGSPLLPFVRDVQPQHP